jgi:hypothetical protein
MPVLLVTVLAAVALFGTAFLAMAVGLLLRGKIMRGGCGSATDDNASPIGCDACSKKQINLCDDEDSTGLAGPSFTATMGRFEKKS